MSKLRRFIGIFIPKEIWENRSLSLEAKCLWGEIHTFGGNSIEGYFASNESLCDLIGLKISRLKKVMKELKSNDLMKAKEIEGEYILHTKLPVSSSEFKDKKRNETEDK